MKKSALEETAGVIMEQALSGIFDSHAHYDDPKFDPDRECLLDSLFTNGMAGIVNAACDPAQAKAASLLAQQYPHFYFAAGIHPEMADGFSPDQISLLERYWKMEKCVAIGEIGLDYHWADPGKEAQLPLFEAQLAAANAQKMPVILHSRDACEDTMTLLHKYRPCGVMHCFSYSKEIAKQVLDLGLYIGFTGAVTFKNARKLPEVAAYIPPDRLLVETDCPYMPPEPFRGTRCDSSLLIYTVEKLAQLRQTTPQVLIAQTTKNAQTLFGIRA